MAQSLFEHRIEPSPLEELSEARPRTTKTPTVFPGRTPAPAPAVPGEPSEKNPLRWVWASVAFLTGAVAGLYWFGYQNLDLLESHAPGLAASVQTVGDTLSGRVEQLEWKMDVLYAQDLNGRLSTLEKSVDGKLAKDRQESNAAADLRNQLSADRREVRSEIDEVKKARANDETKLASIQAELSEVRRDVAVQRNRLDATDYNRAADRDSLLTSVSAVRSGLDGQRQELRNVEQGLEMKRANFNARRGTPATIDGDTIFTVTRIDTARHEVEGSLRLASGETLRVRSLGALRPMAFYPAAEKKRHELGVTHIARDGVSGYLLSPATAQN